MTYQYESERGKLEKAEEELNDLRLSYEEEKEVWREDEEKLAKKVEEL